MPSDGIQNSDVEALREQLSEALSAAAAHLQAIEVRSQAHLREGTTERQHLSAFLDELRYRLSFASSDDGQPKSITGPLGESQLRAMHQQETSLRARGTDLDRLNASLEQISTRVDWLVHQLEGASAWVLEAREGPTSGPAGGLEREAGDQVMWAQIIMGQEAERARLAREIHDGPAQAIANTVLRLQLVEQLYVHRPEEVQGELERLRIALQESLKDVRRFIFNLRPATLAEVGLIGTLTQYTGDYADQFGIPLELNLPANMTLSASQELVVFRVIQEALQNIHKHAQARHIWIDLQQRSGGPLVVRIRDDGRGFDDGSATVGKPASSGLIGMRERAATVGGNLKVETKPGDGTTIVLTLPVAKVAEARTF